MEATTPRRGQLIAAAGGVLLFISLFLPWFNAKASGWELQTMTDVFLLIIAVIAVASLLAPARGVILAGTTLNGATSLLGGVATLVLLWLTVFDFPEVFSREIGLYLALVASAAIALGGYSAARVGAQPSAQRGGPTDDALRLTPGKLIVGAGGGLLFISLFLPWVGQVLIDEHDSVNGWELLLTIDAYFLITAVVALSTALGVRAAVSLPGTTMNGATAVLGGVATILLAWFLLFDFPEFATREIGPYLGLIAAAAIAIGGFVSSGPRSLGQRSGDR